MHLLFTVELRGYQEIRYAGDHNFVGRKIDGYEKPKCVLTTEAAKALTAIQKELRQRSMSLKVYDCYRPQRATSQFLAWASNPNDTKMQQEFYPALNKENLFKSGYISEHSGHSRGSTVDLTIVKLPPNRQEKYRDGDKLRACTLPAAQRFGDNSLDFGTGYDCFDPRANPQNSEITELQKQNRLMLKNLMERHGFKGMATEWWHYTFKDEPFFETYFDFEVK